MIDPLSPISHLASWSGWLPFQQAVLHAPKFPGVYLARRSAHGELIYVGMAGERRGQGLRGRLTVNSRGKAAVSGLGEAALDRALADASWLRQRLDEVERGEPRRTAAWAQLAIEVADLHIAWSTTADRSSAAVLERQVLDVLAEEPLWNRHR
jgi:hypothetical protein